MMNKELVMKTVGQNIRHYRERLGLSQEELANRCGYVTSNARSTISKIETGKNDPTTSTLKTIADALHTTPSALMSQSDDKTPHIKNYLDLKAITTFKVPVIGSVACGKPIFADENFECYVEVGSKIHIDYALRARGDSMINARIHDGDLVFVRQQDTVENGEIAVVLINDEATLKRVFYYPDQQKLVLQAENPKYEPFVYVGEELQNVHVLGKAVAFQSDVR